MYYRIMHKDSKTTTLVEELKTNMDTAQKRAWEILQDKEKKGKVVIERRHSDYVGDFSHWLTCSYTEPVQG